MAPWSTRYFLVLLGFLLVVTFDFGSTAVYETDDAIIVDAEDPDHVTRWSRSVRSSKTVEDYDARKGRQIEGGWPPVLPAGPCFTRYGQLGRCTSFRQCYPYFKLPELNPWETWVLGTSDACTYFNSNGRQQFGVCCTNPSFPSTLRPTQAPRPTPPVPAPPTVITSPSPLPSNPNPPSGGVVPPNWPPTHPPLPTHPPDHTIPPLPTHPPSPGWPGLPQPTLPSEEHSSQPTTLPAPRPTTTKLPSTTTTTKLPSTTTTTRPPLPTAPVYPIDPIRPTNLPSSSARPPATQAPPAVTSVPEVNDTSCGVKNDEKYKIQGGTDASLNEWPWIVALFNGGRQFCGGSLIDSTHILSAAHCVAHMTSWDVPRVTVRLGDHNIKTNSETTHVEKKVKRIVRHRGFDSRTLYNDIAILTLDSPVKFTKNIRTVCLPTGKDLYAGQTATVVGWGSLHERGPQPATLQEVSIPIWSNSECRTKYGNAAPGGIVEHFICAGSAGKDSCSGDSGGPLSVNEGRWTQVGVVSWGIGCGKGQYPGVYTRVTSFLPWIKKNTKI